MSRVCPACGKVLPEIPLPVCAHCGARLEAPPSPPAAEAPAPELTLPVTGFETSAELLERFFDPPVRYMPTATNAALLMLSPWLLPAGGGLLAAWDPRSANPAVLAGLFAAALVLTVWLAATRTPGKQAVVLDRHGVRHRRSRHPWES
ncbi:MAG: hypothetical protein HYU66_19885, partial [Armatimonadetes bacterium]|nr:hypothetical protein [Armatimonadota bacterium]